MDIQCFLVEKTGNVQTERTSYYCEQCKEEHSYNSDKDEWRRLDTGETFFSHSFDLPAGAMYWWECWDVHTDEAGKEIARYKGNGHWNNDDGRHLIVQLPGRATDGSVGMSHRWDVDSRCSNCTLPDDRMHRCWIRTGEPPRVSAGKAGYTCSAGAGSIRIEWWHGFLVDGVLKEC